MSWERWILVDKRVSREKARSATRDDDSTARYFGSNFAWTRTLKEAKPFTSRSEAELYAKAEWHAIKRVVPAGTRRARAAAQADADNVATMRAELDGLRATDAECAAALARWQFRAEIAETAYDGLRTEFESARHTLGATDAESVVAAAMRVVSERDGAVRDLAELRRAIEVLTVRMGG